MRILITAQEIRGRLIEVQQAVSQSRLLWACKKFG
jgi:hypothetical protein